MCLVDDYRVVLHEVAVALDLGEQDSIGHHLDAGVDTDLVVEPHLVADGVADLGAELLGDAFGDRPRRDASGLGVADPPAASGRLVPPAPSGLETQLGELCALARAGLAGDDQHLVRADRCDEVVTALTDRELWWVGDDRFHEVPRVRRRGRRAATPVGWGSDPCIGPEGGHQYNPALNAPEWDPPAIGISEWGEAPEIVELVEGAAVNCTP